MAVKVKSPQHQRATGRERLGVVLLLIASDRNVALYIVTDRTLRRRPGRDAGNSGGRREVELEACRENHTGRQSGREVRMS